MTVAGALDGGTGAALVVGLDDDEVPPGTADNPIAPAGSAPAATAQ